MKKLMGKKDARVGLGLSFGIMVFAIIMIGVEGVRYNLFGGDLGILMGSLALFTCLFVLGAVTGVMTMVLRTHAKTVKEIRMATCWNVDCLTDEIRECHNLDDNQA